MDKKQSELIEKYQESILHKQNEVHEEQQQSESDDDLLDLLNEDDDEILSKYRESRIQQLSKEFKKIDNAVNNNDEVGGLVSLNDEKKVMEIVTSRDIVLIHFYQPGFQKCKIMNEKLAILAEKHLTLNILIIKAEDAPFLVSKLNIKVLPFVVVYKNGNELTRIVGFEKLGNNPHDLSVESLEQFLYLNKIINRKTINFASIKSGSSLTTGDSDDDLDL